MATDTKLEQYRRMLANAQERVRIARKVHPAGVKAHMADVKGWQRVIRRHLRSAKRNPAMTRLHPHGRHEKVETKVRRKSSTGEYVVSLYIDNVKQRNADYFTTDRADAHATARLMMERGVKSNPRHPRFEYVTCPVCRHPNIHVARRGDREAFIKDHDTSIVSGVRCPGSGRPVALSEIRATPIKRNPRGKPRAGSRLPSGTSSIWGRPIKTWKRDGFTLRLYDTNVPTGTGRMGDTFLAYDFFDGTKLIFTGDRYRVGAGTPIDSTAAVYGLLGFLSLKEGDTDAEYFKDYSPAQLAWSQSGRADELSLIVHDNEDRALRRAFRR